jgi:hypothetical protein
LAYPVASLFEGAMYPVRRQQHPSGIYHNMDWDMTLTLQITWKYDSENG